MKCGDKYSCEEKCIIGCKHEKCNRKCGELCKRKPCEERCNIKMECGHQCYGLCGERCPNIYRICNPDIKYFEYIKENELIYKTKCGHIFSVNEFRQIFQ